MSKGRKEPDKKFKAKREPYYSFTLPSHHFHDAPNTTGSQKLVMADIGVENQSVPTMDTRNKIAESKGAKMGLRMPFSDETDNKRTTASLVHDKKKGITNTMSGDCPGYFRARQLDKLRGFKQCPTADETNDLWLIKHNPVHWDHDPFFQKFEPREKV